MEEEGLGKMKQGRRRILVALVAALVAANGCALISIRTETRDEPPVLYSATRFDAHLAVIGPLTGWPSVPAPFRPSTPECILMVPLFLADGVVSIVGDTLLLPYDSYHRRRLEADREFWQGVFLGGIPLPTVEAMRRHLTRYSGETVAWHVESELAREGDVDGESLPTVGGWDMVWGAHVGQAPAWPMILDLDGTPLGGLGDGMGMGGMGDAPADQPPEEPDRLAEEQSQMPEPEKRQRRAARPACRCAPQGRISRSGRPRSLAAGYP